MAAEIFEVCPPSKVTNTYEMSLKIENGKIKVVPHEKKGSKPSYQNTLKGFSLTLADHLDQEGDYLQHFMNEAISEVIMDYLASTGCIEEYFEHECYDVPIIEVSGAFVDQMSFTYDLKVEVTDPSTSAGMVAVSEFTEEDWQNLHESEE